MGASGRSVPVQGRFFDSRWYAWQNPDWRHEFVSVEDHYINVGRYENRDPCAIVDMVRFGEVVGGAIPPEHRLAAIGHGLDLLAFGVYKDLGVLRKVQRLFLESLRITVLGPDQRRNRSNLVLLQAGPQSCHSRWFEQGDRSWDLIVNYYDTSGIDKQFGDLALAQPGTKFTAVANIVREMPDLLSDYQYVLLLDDDILVSMEGLERLFSICAQEDLALAQMSLTADSPCAWPVLHHRSEAAMRAVTAVEIMMPVFSGEAMKHCSETFQRSVSGFGLDLLWGLLCARLGPIAVIDAVVAQHLKTIDEASGSYYSMLRRRSINPKAELWSLMQQFNLTAGIDAAS